MINDLLYEKDFYAWTEEQSELIRKKAFNELDLVHLQEELTYMGAREKSELKNRLAILLMHLLKWKYRPARQSKSWQYTIDEQRDELIDLLEDNPSLRTKLPELMIKSYKKARREAIGETGLDESIFPDQCEWKIEQILREKFLPN